jgi:hypothetical protein
MNNKEWCDRFDDMLIPLVPMPVQNYESDSNTNEASERKTLWSVSRIEAGSKDREPTYSGKQTKKKGLAEMGAGAESAPSDSSSNQEGAALQARQMSELRSSNETAGPSQELPKTSGSNVAMPAVPREKTFPRDLVLANQRLLEQSYGGGEARESTQPSDRKRGAALATDSRGGGFILGSAITGWAKCPALPTILAAAMLLGGCATAPTTTQRTNGTKARVTYYSSHEDKYGSRIASGGRAKEGVTIAAPSRWRFGQRICIPALCGLVGNGHFTVQDRGGAVESRKAIWAQKDRRIPKIVGAEVFDVYLAGSKRFCQQRMVQLTRKIGYYTNYYPE